MLLAFDLIVELAFLLLLCVSFPVVLPPFHRESSFYCRKCRSKLSSSSASPGTVTMFWLSAFLSIFGILGSPWWPSPVDSVPAANPLCFRAFLISCSISSILPKCVLNTRWRVIVVAPERENMEVPGPDYLLYSASIIMFVAIKSQIKT